MLPKNTPDFFLYCYSLTCFWRSCKESIHVGYVLNSTFLRGTGMFSRNDTFVLSTSPVPKLHVSFLTIFLIVLLFTYFLCVSIKANDTAFCILSISLPFCVFFCKLYRNFWHHTAWSCSKLPILGMLMCQQIYIHQKTFWKTPLQSLEVKVLSLY